MNKAVIALALVTSSFCTGALAAPGDALPHTFSNGTPADATQVNANFSELLNQVTTLSTTGVAGPQGPIGLTGPKGGAGPIGLQGAPGLQGLSGLTGPKGDAGPIGLQGAPGLQGLSGLTGPKGDAGPIGAPGLEGLSGAQGIQGETGVKGETGLTGAPGPQGEIGPQGPAGNATTEYPIIGYIVADNLDPIQFHSFEFTLTRTVFPLTGPQTVVNFGELSLTLETSPQAMELQRRMFSAEVISSVDLYLTSGERLLQLDSVVSSIFLNDGSTQNDISVSLAYKSLTLFKGGVSAGYDRSQSSPTATCNITNTAFINEPSGTVAPQQDEINVNFYTIGSVRNASYTNIGSGTTLSYEDYNDLAMELTSTSYDPCYLSAFLTATPITSVTLDVYTNAMRLMSYTGTTLWISSYTLSSDETDEINQTISLTYQDLGVDVYDDNGKLSSSYGYNMVTGLPY